MLFEDLNLLKSWSYTIKHNRIEEDVMKKHFLLLIILFAIALNGCTSFGRISYIPNPDQKAIFDNGKETLISKKTHTVAVALNSPKYETGTKADFIVTVNNGLARDIIFSTENITAYLENDTGDKKDLSLKIYSYDDLIWEEKKRKAMQTFAVVLGAIGGAMQASQAGRQQSYGTYSSNSGYGTYSGTTYNAAAAQQAQNAVNARTTTQMNAVSSQSRAKRQELTNTILKKQTVFPNAWHGGIVKMKAPRLAEEPIPVILNIDVDGEIHQFKLKFEKVKQ